MLSLCQCINSSPNIPAHPLYLLKLWLGPPLCSTQINMEFRPSPLLAINARLLNKCRKYPENRFAAERLERKGFVRQTRQWERGYANQKNGAHYWCSNCCCVIVDSAASLCKLGSMGERIIILLDVSFADWSNKMCLNYRNWPGLASPREISWTCYELLICHACIMHH